MQINLTRDQSQHQAARTNAVINILSISHTLQTDKQAPSFNTAYQQQKPLVMSALRLNEVAVIL